MIDIHNHLFMNVDDGPSSPGEVRDLLNQAVSQGITHVFCTPHHHSGSYTTPSDIVYRKIKDVRAIIEQESIDIEVHPGQEIRINDDMITELKSGESIPLNDSNYVLVEFDFYGLRRDVHEVLNELKTLGYTPIIAHPERCRPIAKDVSHLERMVENGVKAQVTAASVSGDLGSHLQLLSLKWIESGFIHIVASDAHHARYRPFTMEKAFDVIENRLGSNVKKTLIQNAEAVLNNKVF